MPTPTALTAPRLLNKDQRDQKEQLMDAGNEAFDADALQAAFECYHKASLLDPSDPEVWNCLGLTYANMDYLQEAWRSYRLALLADPENLNAMWYSAEFLYNQEDFELCQLLLQRYLQFEEDPEQRSEAEELLQEVNHLFGEEAASPLVALDEEGVVPDEEEAELPAGFDSEDAKPVVAEDDEDDFGDDTDVADAELDSGRFYASVELRLGDTSRVCKNCTTLLPYDAPFCYSCNQPCFYSEER